MCRHEEIAQQIRLLLRQGVPADFAGFGVVIYRGCLDDLPVSPLLDDSEIEPPINDDAEIANLLLSISRYSDTRHDGFHFIHECRGLTHLCQFFSPPIPTSYKPKQYGVGARHRSSELGSLMNDVTAVIVVERDGDISVFISGTSRVLKHEA
jgi:DNA integrity scanning protein DisA with diadenylate cyclase activity